MVGAVPSTIRRSKRSARATFDGLAHGSGSLWDRGPIRGVYYLLPFRDAAFN